MDRGHGIEVADEAIASFCDAHRVRRLALFGSVLGDRFAKDSDLDVLIEFERGSTPGLLGIAEMELDLRHSLVAGSICAPTAI